MRNTCESCKSKELEPIDFSKSVINIDQLNPSSVMVTNKEYGSCLEMVKCSKCGLVQSSNILSTSQIVNLYKDMDDKTYEESSLQRGFSNASQILKLLNKYIQNKHKKSQTSIFEIGAGSGSTLKFLKEKGYKVSGLEPNKSFTEYAQNRYGIKIENKSIEKSSQSNLYDVVLAIDVIEHVTSPSSLIKKANSMLKEDGLLILVTPDVNSIAHRFLKKNWWHIRPPHIYYFNDYSMKILLESNNFQLIHKQYFYWSLQAGYLLDSIFKILFKRSFPYRQKLSMLAKINLFDSKIYCAKKHTKKC